MQKIEIFEQKTADIDVRPTIMHTWGFCDDGTFDCMLYLFQDEIDSSKILEDAEKLPEPSKVRDTAGEHKSHLFDQHCSICTKKKDHDHKEVRPSWTSRYFSSTFPSLTRSRLIPVKEIIERNKR